MTNTPPLRPDWETYIGLKSGIIRAPSVRSHQGRGGHRWN